MDESTLNEDDKKSTVERYHKGRKIFGARGFELIKWASNSPISIKNIPNEDLAETEILPTGTISYVKKCLVFLIYLEKMQFSFSNTINLQRTMLMQN